MKNRRLVFHNRFAAPPGIHRILSSSRARRVNRYSVDEANGRYRVTARPMSLLRRDRHFGRGRNLKG